MAAFFNQAILSYSGGTVNSNVTTGELVEVLTVSKTAVVDEYSQGSDITYIINVVNSGNVSYSGLTLTDDLGAYTFNTSTLQPLDYVEGSVKYFINGVLQAAPAVTTVDGISITPISVPANGVAAVAYTVTANEFAPPIGTGTVANTATVSGNGIIDISATETVTASASPSLGITKSISPSVITENDPFTYTFVISNYGNTVATVADNVVVTDTFDPAFETITVTYNGTLWTSPDDYTYDPSTGLFTTSSGAITVPAATYTQDPTTGEWTVTPGTSTLTVTGTI